MASNFPVVLAAMAATQLEALGIDPPAAHGVVVGLISAAADSLKRMPPSRALTGPVSRGDVDTVARHLAVLEDNPQALAVYIALSLATVELAAAGGADTDRLLAILTTLRRPTSPDDRQP
jgi:predicted short-subunit dehydrogenase-like oxidoreductase (DUF2520 family)